MSLELDMCRNCQNLGMCSYWAWCGLTEWSQISRTLFFEMLSPRTKAAGLGLGPQVRPWKNVYGNCFAVSAATSLGRPCNCPSRISLYWAFDRTWPGEQSTWSLFWEYHGGGVTLMNGPGGLNGVGGIGSGEPGSGIRGGWMLQMYSWELSNLGLHPSISNLSSLTPAAT